MLNVALPGLKAAMLTAFIIEARRTADKVHVVSDASWVTDPALKQHIRDGLIFLNMSERATGNFNTTEEYVCGNMRFGGKPVQVFIPFKYIQNVTAMNEKNEALAIWDTQTKDIGTVIMNNLNFVEQEQIPPVKERPKLSVVK